MISYGFTWPQYVKWSRYPDILQVWDLSNPAHVKNSHRVRTIASVARIKWRPQRRHHIASCSLLVDFNINVWEIRRPYIPFAAFSEHKDVVTGQYSAKASKFTSSPQIFEVSVTSCVYILPYQGYDEQNYSLKTMFIIYLSCGPYPFLELLSWYHPILTRSLQLAWRLGISWMNVMLHDLQMMCSDLIIW